MSRRPSIVFALALTALLVGVIGFVAADAQQSPTFTVDHYEVVAGDTLTIIAGKYCPHCTPAQRTTLAGKIRVANRLATNAVLNAGNVLHVDITDIPAVPPSTTTTVAATSTTAAPPSTTTTLPPTTTTTAPPAGRFTTLPVGAALPSDATCASRVRPMTENRSENGLFNNTRGTNPNNETPRVTGNYVGTTDMIIQWAACKWGLDEDWARAQAALESSWRQNDTFGDFGSDPAACLPGHPIGADGVPGQCPQSIGLLQVRYPFHQTAFEDNNAINSTAYNADYAWSIWRRCFEGEFTWLNTVERGQDYVAGDALGCMGVWFSGRWYTPAAQGYMNRVRDDYFTPRWWERPDFPPAVPTGGPPSSTTTSLPPSPTTTVAPTTSAATTTTAPASTTTSPASTTTLPPTSTTHPPSHGFTPCAWPTAIPMGALAGQPGPMFCTDLVDAGQTFTQGANSWVDEFNHGASLAEIGDGYLTFEAGDMIGVNQVWKAVHWRHNDHWMVDVAPNDQDGDGGPADDWGTGGTVMRPNRTFRFVNGKLIIEADVAAGITDYTGEVWPELVVSTSPAPAMSEPSNGYDDYAYAYGWFPNGATVGIRLQADGVPIAALMQQNGTTDNRDDRTWELSYFQHAGETTSQGGYPGFAPGAHRFCSGTDPDTMCRDRFRWEITKTGFDLYVNGQLYMRKQGFPAASQLPDSLVNGDVFVYFADVIYNPGADTVRFHWDHLAVNP